MASRDDDRLRIKPGAPKRPDGSRSGQRAQRFVSQVLKQVSKAGAKSSGARGARPASTFGRGRVAYGMAGGTLGADARRVIIKSRYVVLKKTGVNAVSTHLRYIERDGVTRDGQRGQAYGPETDTADLRAFEERGRGDRHQFRFIVSVEDAGELEDLRGYTREFMQRMTELVRSTLRLRPDRIIVGEVRGAEALDLLKAWGTGHPGGIATVHAGSAAGALLRLEQLILEVAVTPPRALIAEAVNVIVYIAGRGHARRIQEIARVIGFDSHGYQLSAELMLSFPPIPSRTGEP